MFSCRNILKALTQSLKEKQRLCHSKVTKPDKALLIPSTSDINNANQHTPSSDTMPSGKKVVISAYPSISFSNSILSERKLAKKEIKDTVEVMDRERLFGPYGH
jgi:hypothetical protein